MRPAPSIHFYPSETPPAGGEINANTIVIDGPERLIIDPGLKSRWPLLAGRLAADGFEPAGFQLALFTHGHPDHLGAAEILARDYGLPLALHKLELEFLAREGEGFWGSRPPGDFFQPLTEGLLLFGGRRLFLYHAPGHSPGSLVLHWPEEGLLVTGDVYFSGTFGATDYPGGSEPAMFETLARLEKLPGVELALCGHGPALTGRAAVAANYAVLRREVELKKAGLWPPRPE